MKSLRLLLDSFVLRVHHRQVPVLQSNRNRVDGHLWVCQCVAFGGFALGGSIPHSLRSSALLLGRVHAVLYQWAISVPILPTETNRSEWGRPPCSWNSEVYENGECPLAGSLRLVNVPTDFLPNSPIAPSWALGFWGFLRWAIMIGGTSILPYNFGLVAPSVLSVKTCIRFSVWAFSNGGYQYSL